MSDPYRTPQSRRVARRLSYSGALGSAITNAVISNLPAQYRIPARAGHFLMNRAARLIQRRWRSRRAARGGPMDVQQGGRRRRIPMSRARRMRAAGFTGISNGSYQGKFKKPKKNKSTFQTLAQSQGYQVKREVHGAIADPDCVYLGHGTHSVNMTARMICGALVRKLFKKAGVILSRPDEELPLFDTTDADGFKIVLDWSFINGTVGSFTYVTVNDDTLDKVIDQFQGQFMNALESDFSGYAFEKFALYSSDRNGVSTNWRVASVLNLKNEVVMLKIYSSLMIQNRTKGATAPEGDNEADRVDNQPLQGYLYHMNGATPQLKIVQMNNSHTLEAPGRDTSIMLVRGQQLGTLLQEPPLPKTFSNCYKSVKVRLEPGTMKRTVIYIVHTGYLNNILGKLRVQQFGGFLSRGPGKFQLFSLEEAMNSGSGNNITVNYEAQQVYSCVTKTNAKSIMLPRVLTEVADNLP